jgi:hypothetical protein
MALGKKALMAASGDLRQSANETCWPAQEAMEKQAAAALAAELRIEVSLCGAKPNGAPLLQ